MGVNVKELLKCHADMIEVYCEEIIHALRDGESLEELDYMCSQLISDLVHNYENVKEIFVAHELDSESLVWQCFKSRIYTIAEEYNHEMSLLVDCDKYRERRRDNFIAIAKLNNIYSTYEFKEMLNRYDNEGFYRSLNDNLKCLRSHLDRYHSKLDW